MSADQAEAGNSDVPLCVDLDGTLLRSDLLHESILALLRQNVLYALLLPVWLMRGKAHFKREIARRISLPVGQMPYDARVLEVLRASAHRQRVLCTAADETLAQAIASHLGVFDLVIASDGAVNLAGSAKADALVRLFGVRGFDYMGNHAVDLDVWKSARRAWVVNAPDALHTRARSVCDVEAVWPRARVGAMGWAKAFRVHQWLKNVLVFVPLFAAHLFFDAASVIVAIAAFIAFSACASGVYLTNDLLDLGSDRMHPRKRQRPFASGLIPVSQGALASVVVTVSGFAIAFWVSVAFAIALGIYWLTTLAYSFRLKRVEMLDVIVLAGLYTIRIIAGAVAIAVPLSFWLLAFSMFVFLSMAMLKRYTELLAMASDGRESASGRGYATTDLPLLQSLGGAAGYTAVMVLALYINSAESVELYSRPHMLWLICPLLLYWISRAWSVAHRGNMHDDPVIFAVKDRTSQLVIFLCGLALLLAI